MARRRKHEEHANHEAWAIPYGDLITLLLAFFVVMYSMSSVNEGKYRILSDSLVAAFRGEPKTVTPVKVGKDKAAGKGAKLTGVAPTTLLKLRDPKQVAEAPPPQRSQEGHAALAQMATEVRKAMQGLIDEGDVRIREMPRWLEVEVKTDILFASGDARVSPAANPIVEKLAGILAPFPNPLRVEGHTDNVPIRTAAFPSNWELSAGRAANVVQLFTKSGIDPLRMQIIGLGEYHPVAPNDTVDGRNRNRRVVIVVLEAEPQGQGSYRAPGGAAPASPAPPAPRIPVAGNPPPGNAMLAGTLPQEAAVAR